MKLLSKFIRALQDYEDEISAAVEADLGGNIFSSGVKGYLECGAMIQEVSSSSDPHCVMQVLTRDYCVVIALPLQWAWIFFSFFFAMRPMVNPVIQTSNK